MPQRRLVLAKKAVVKIEDSDSIAQYNPVTAGLAELRSRYEGKLFDCTDPEEEKAARLAVREHVKLRTSLEAVRKEIKEPALRHCQFIDSEARRIDAEIRKTEDPIYDQIQAEEKRRQEIEAARVAAIKTKIDQACLVGMGNVTSSRGELAGWIAELEGRTFSLEEYQEFVDIAQAMHESELDRLRTLLRHRSEADAREAAIADEKKALEQAKAEQARRDEEERASMAAERAAHEAEMAAKRAEQERLDREARARREEEDRIAREQREEEARKAKEAAALERAEREEQDRLAREKREAEEKRVLEARAELEREQAIREKAAREIREASEATEKKLRDAAPEMLKALQSVRADPAWLSISSDTQKSVESAIGLAGAPA
jgi:hypothetical protein